jgi:hypothetical protein
LVRLGQKTAIKGLDIGSDFRQAWAIDTLVNKALRCTLPDTAKVATFGRPIYCEYLYEDSKGATKNLARADQEL